MITLFMAILMAKYVNSWEAFIIFEAMAFSYIKKL